MEYKIKRIHIKTIKNKCYIPQLAKFQKWIQNKEHLSIHKLNQKLDYQNQMFKLNRIRKNNIN